VLFLDEFQDVYNFPCRGQITTEVQGLLETSGLFVMISGSSSNLPSLLYHPEDAANLNRGKLQPKLLDCIQKLDHFIAFVDSLLFFKNIKLNDDFYIALYWKSSGSYRYIDSVCQSLVMVVPTLDPMQMILKLQSKWSPVSLPPPKWNNQEFISILALFSAINSASDVVCKDILLIELI